MKKSILFLLILFFTSVITNGQTIPGKIKIQLNNNFTNQPITSTSFTLVLNDSIKETIKTDTLGYALLGNIKKGSYKVQVFCDNFQTIYYSNILIDEGKTTFSLFKLMPTNPNQNRMTAEQKAFHGIK
ncbi:MAG: carboxypeptidase-like regulatory domain-containing protein [Bacteroidota bacterium]|nr:carboxypeptidase-like regulatory domain-containing protein [Bacteroidota bacterium]